MEDYILSHRLTEEETFRLDAGDYLNIQIRVVTKDGEVIPSYIIVKTVAECLDNKLLTSPETPEILSNMLVGRTVVNFPEINGVNQVNFGEDLKISPPASNTGGIRLAEVTLLADRWVGDGSPYSQVVEVAGATENSQIDLTPSVEQLVIFYDKDLTFVTENNNGVVTVYAIGQKPENDYVMQATVKEVSV